MTPRQSLWKSLKTRSPLTVGAIADPGAFQTLHPDCDVVELRIDSLGLGSEVFGFAEACPLPLLITARGSAEGGQSDWTPSDRIEAYQKLMPYASAIDIELRDFDPLGEVISTARKQEVVVVGSFHDFEKTPEINELGDRNHPHADILKFALMARSLACVQRQLSLFEALPDRALSVMGMGPLGAAARPLMAKAGSLLNYGFLGARPTAPNQWPSGLLRQALSV